MKKIVYAFTVILIIFCTNKSGVSNDEPEYISLDVTFNFGPLYVISTKRIKFNERSDSTTSFVRFVIPYDIIVDQKCYDIVKEFVIKKRKVAGIQLNELELQKYCPPPIINYMKNSEEIFSYVILSPSIFNKFCRDLLDTLKSNDCNNHRLISTFESFICEPFNKK